ncbi:MAG: hypothetical protein JSW20_14530 [Nitrospiraceae bacterium]|nr:MAG: hypothetical protein JSW20_14530 [Nitrospiraceae bacterium]
MILTHVKDRLTNNDLVIKLRHALNVIKESKPVQWTLIREEQIASCLFYLWIFGCAYWIHQLITIEARPRADWLYMIEDTREALMILFFGSFGLSYAAGIGLFICKLMYNLFHGGLESIFPRQWHSTARSFSYIIILGISFLYIQNIKIAGLTAYNQVSQLVQTSDRHEDVAEDNIKGLMQLLDIDKNPVE